MSSDRVIKKIKTYAILSFLLPLIAINLTLFSYKFLGDYEIYKGIGWNEKKIEFPLIKKSTYDGSEAIKKLHEGWEQPKRYSDAKYSFIDCPKFEVKAYDATTEGLLEHTNENISLIIKLRNNNESLNEVYMQNNIVNKHCVKNNKTIYFFLSKFKSLEQLLINTKLGDNSGFAEVKNPYLYGEVSISRTARFFPNNLIFKPLIIFSAFLLFLYWKSNLNIFNNKFSKFSKKFFYFGLLSCILLTLHAIFLGVEFDIKFYEKMRRLIIILFICFEVIAQIFLTKEIYLNKEKFKNEIRLLILKTKILFVSIVFILTVISAIILVFFDPHTSFKHMLEWNYFAFLLFFYFLSFSLWKFEKSSFVTTNLN